MVAITYSFRANSRNSAMTYNEFSSEIAKTLRSATTYANCRVRNKPNVSLWSAIAAMGPDKTGKCALAIWRLVGFAA
jgi:hypothetical protein